MIRITTASEIRTAIIILLRFFVGGCGCNSCGCGLIVSAGVRKKLAGGGVSGGLISGCGRPAIGCGSMVCSLNRPVRVGFLPVSASKLEFSGLCLGCRGTKPGGMVGKASSRFSGSTAISAPQWGQKRYLRVSTSGSCRLHLGQASRMFVYFIVFGKF
jgi:hypothetical protein